MINPFRIEINGVQTAYPTYKKHRFCQSDFQGSLRHILNIITNNTGRSLPAWKPPWHYRVEN